MRLRPRTVLMNPPLRGDPRRLPDILQTMNADLEPVAAMAVIVSECRAARAWVGLDLPLVLTPLLELDDPETALALDPTVWIKRYHGHPLVRGIYNLRRHGLAMFGVEDYLVYPTQALADRVLPHQY